VPGGRTDGHRSPRLGALVSAARTDDRPRARAPVHAEAGSVRLLAAIGSRGAAVGRGSVTEGRRVVGRAEPARKINILA